MKFSREQILALEGQELVGAVAEHPQIMGWHEMTHPAYAGPHWCWCSDGKHLVGNHTAKINWNPLTDENHLAEVREKMIEKYEEDSWLGKEGIAITYVLSSDHTKHGSASSPKHQDRPLVTLRAALLAVESEEK